MTRPCEYSIAIGEEPERRWAAQFSYFAPYRSPRLGNPRVFYTLYLVYIWHCRIKLFLRHLPNCPCSNFSRYVDLFQEISPRIAQQVRFQVKLHHLRTITLGFFTNGIPSRKTQMRSEYFSRNFLPENINRWKNITADGLFRKNGKTTMETLK